MKRLALSGWLWKLRTALQKRWISLGWFSYARWIRENETKKQDTQAAGRGSFSLLVVVERQILSLVGETLDSLRRQTNPAWQAVILLEGVSLEEMAAAHADLLSGEPRMHLLSRTSTQSQAEALKSCLDALPCDWVAVLGCGDTLSADTLSRLAETAASDSATQIIYTDEDRLTPQGERVQPFFKPDWSPELLLSRNYLLHAFFRRSLLLQALASSQDFEEVVFRSAETAQYIAHLPAPLYHVSPSSPAWFPETPRAAQVAAHLERQGLAQAQAELSARGQVRVSWSFSATLVSIIIPTRDNAVYLRRCLETIRLLTKEPSYEVILVDSGSRESETHLLYNEYSQDARLRVISHAGKFNFSRALNQGARQAQGDIFVFLNNDTEALDGEWLRELAQWAAIPAVGVVGAQLLYPDGTIQHAGIVIGMEGHASHVFNGTQPDVTGPFGSPQWYRDTSAVTGACLAVRRSVFEQVGGFDEAYQLVFSDVAFCLKVLQSGYRIVYNPFARLVHHEGRTRFRHIPGADIRLGAEHFAEIVRQGDPFYNLNLSLAVRIPALRRRDEDKPLNRLEKIVKYLS